MPAVDQRRLDLVRLAALDEDSRRWVTQLRVGHPRRDQTIEKLHDVLRRVAWFELSRRRQQLGWVSGPEFEDLAQQAADDALVKVLDRLDEFRGLSRFTTWAYKFVMFEVSAKVPRHAWRRQPPSVEERPGIGCPIVWHPDPRTDSTSRRNLRRYRTRSAAARTHRAAPASLDWSTEWRPSAAQSGLTAL